MLRVSAMLKSDEGKVEAIEVKIRIDIPLPTPRSVISSPIHMIKPVPAVMVRTIKVTPIGDESVRIGSTQSAPNRAP
ncbi:unannotated protein [freshwater metagenome]|uniref:Unannotated protein n=1 Tax=freshwater metagenome TaxID=449393 RepID=A0A6J6K2R1_9ZZZZ